MPNIAGGLGGAATGAKLGTMVLPGWGTAIGAGVGAIAGLFTGGKSKLQKQMENKINPSMENLMNWSGQSRDKQNEMYGIGKQGMQNAGNFYNALLSPNSTGALQQILGPQMTGINDQYQGLLNNASNFGVRGGGKNMQMANADFSRNRALMELVPQLKMQAAEGALKVGQAAGAQSLDWGSLSNQQQIAVLQAATGGMVQNQQGLQATKDQGMAGIMSQLGELLGPALKGIKGGGAFSGATATGSVRGSGGGGLWDSLG